MDQKNIEPAQADADRKTYARPELTVYGTVKKLVQSGCSGRRENYEHNGHNRARP